MLDHDQGVRYLLPAAEKLSCSTVDSQAIGSNEYCCHQDGVNQGDTLRSLFA